MAVEGTAARTSPGVQRGTRPRKVPGSELELSEIGLGWPDPLGSAGVSPTNPLISSRLIAARQSGVSLFDFSSSTEVDALASMVDFLGTERAPPPVLLVPASPGGGRTGKDDLSRPGGGSGRRLEVVRLEDRPDGGGAKGRAHGVSSREWAVRIASTSADPARLALAFEEGARFALLSASLLDAAALEELTKSLPADRGGLVITDPFAGGRFDGRFLNPGLPAPRAPGPTESSALRERFAPVLRFGFLPIARRRTLAQASLLYLLQLPRVLSVVVPLDSPEGLAQGLALAQVPSLTGAELQKVRLASAGAV